MSITNIKQIDRLIALLSDPQREQDDYSFQLYVNEAIQYIGLTAEDFAHQFSTSLPTIKRWRDGKGAPYGMMRPIVLDWILDQALRCKRKAE